MRHDLKRLLELLKFPALVRFGNRSVLPGEEILLRGLYELCQGGSKHTISANVFGREWSSQVRAFNYFIDHIHDNFHHLITDNLEWWWKTGLMEQSRDAIWKRMTSSSPSLLEIDDLLRTLFFLIISLHSIILGFCCFIDCNCLETSRVGGGPAEGLTVLNLVNYL